MTAPIDYAAMAIYEAARHVGIPAETIDRFLGTLKMCGYVLASEPSLRAAEAAMRDAERKYEHCEACDGWRMVEP